MSEITAEQTKQMAEDALGFVPNLIEKMNVNPVVAAIYLQGQDALGAGVLSKAEQQAVMLAASAYNDCHYCTAAHRAGAKQAGVSDEAVDALDQMKSAGDARLSTLAEATWKVQKSRGHLSDDDLEQLENEGISRAALYEIITIIGLKTISNYVNHLAKTEIDEAFAGEATREAA